MYCFLALYIYLVLALLFRTLPTGGGGGRSTSIQSQWGGGGTPLASSRMGVPPSSPTRGTQGYPLSGRMGVPPLQSGRMGYPPPQPPLGKMRHSCENITSCHPSDAGGNDLKNDQKYTEDPKGIQNVIKHYMYSDGIPYLLPTSINL